MTEATTAARDLSPGTVLDGMYTTGVVIRRRPGATTYQAIGPSEEPLAVTVYDTGCFANADAREDSLQAIRALESVDSPAVLEVVDSGRLDNGGIYEIHERFDGAPLSELSALSPADAQAILGAVIDGLVAGTDEGVIHRNLGPEVVFRGADGAVKLGGFAVGEPRERGTGSLATIAPEQIQGGQEHGEATLVYNVAALAVRLVAGRALFLGSEAAQLRQHEQGELPASLPAALRDALAKQPEQRGALEQLRGQLAELARGPFELPEAPPEADSPAVEDRLEVTLTPVEQSAPADGNSASEKPVAAQLAKTPESASGAAADAPPAAEKTAPAPKESSPDGSKPSTVGPTNTAKAAASTAAPDRVQQGTDVAKKSDKPSAPKKPAARAPQLAPPPTLGTAKPATPPSVGGAPKVTPPTAPKLGVPSISVPSISPPAVTAPKIGAPKIGAPNISAPSLTPPTLGAPKPPSATKKRDNDAPKPRTRGWTMFMEATDEDDEAAVIAATPSPTPTPTPAPTPTPTPTKSPSPAPSVPPAAGGATKPSTRGWTMIMDDADEAEVAAATPGGVTPPPAAAANPNITTRGWTMLDELNEDDSSPHSVPLAPAKPAAKPRPPGKPSSRGWTMFMEAELEASRGNEAPEEDLVDHDPDFYEGPVYTDTGTVVSMAPTADNPNVGGPPISRMPAEAEPLTSFASRLHGDSQPEPAPAPEPEPDPEPEFPTFAQGGGFGGGLAPPPTSFDQREPALEANTQDNESAVSGPGRAAPVSVEKPSNTTHTLLIVLLLLVVILAIYLAINPQP